MNDIIAQSRRAAESCACFHGVAAALREPSPPGGLSSGICERTAFPPGDVRALRPGDRKLEIAGISRR